MAEPHTSFANPPEYNALYSEFTTGEVIAIPNGGEKPPKEMLIPRGEGEYYANITYMDAQLGRVLHWLKAHDLEKDTVVVFSSDNGPVTSRWINWWEVNAYGSTGGLRGRKHYLYEGGIRVPTIIRYPGVTKANSVSDEAVVAMDLFVTLSNIGGGKVPNDRALDGIDIQAVFSGEKLPQRSLFWALSAKSDLEFAVRQGDWKLLLDREQAPRELYNLGEDPMEFFNLIDSNKKKAQHLTKLAMQHLESIEDDPLRPDLNQEYVQ